MLLRRCAWHRRYHGYVKFLGVAKWRGWGLSFSDGMCTSCSAKARAEWSLPANARPAIIPKRRSLRPDFALATGLLLVGVGVAFGVLIGPPPRTGSAPIEPSTNLATGDGRELAVKSDGDRAVVPGAPYGSSVTAALASPRAVAVEVPTALEPVRPRSFRIMRTVAKRPTRATYQPAIVRSSEPVSEPARQAADTPPKLTSEEIPALDRIPLQAP